MSALLTKNTWPNLLAEIDIDCSLMSFTNIKSLPMLAKWYWAELSFSCSQDYTIFIRLDFWGCGFFTLFLVYMRLPIGLPKNKILILLHLDSSEWFNLIKILMSVLVFCQLALLVPLYLYVCVLRVHCLLYSWVLLPY